MNKKKIPFKLVMLLVAVIPMATALLLTTIFSTKFIENLVIKEIETELAATVKQADQHFKEMSGDWSEKDGKVYHGENEIKEDDPFFDSMVDQEVHMTLFWGDTRVATSITDNGKRVVGTQASEGVIKDVLQGGNTKFIDHVTIVGQDFSGYYLPLKNAAGETVGMLFTGKPYTETQKEINGIVLKIVIIALIVAAIFVVTVFLIANSIGKRLRAMQGSIGALENGDFCAPVKNENAIREFSETCVSMENMRSRLQGVLAEVRKKAEDVGITADDTMAKIQSGKTTVTDISQATSDLANGATMMAQDVQNTSDLVINIGNSVEQVLTSASANMSMSKQVYDMSSSVQEQMESLQKEDKETDRIAGEVQKSVNEMAGVVDDISKAAEAIIGIASQTNLLALNASIEAARAGEAGKGFAVVADNIKGLAEESDKSAKEITGMLSRISELSDRNKDLTGKIKEATANESVEFDHMGTSFDEMKKQLEETEEATETIEKLAESVNKDKDEIMNAVESLSSVSEENAASSEETAASLSLLDANMDEIAGQAEELKTIAGELKETVGFFKV